MKKITFDSKTRDFVLDTFNKKCDKEGYLVDKDTNERVLTPDGIEIKTDKFAGVTRGSEIYIKDDLSSLVKLSKSLQDKTQD